ncbi:MAG: glycosyltransferase family 4 protein, partial [Actinomycetales bacterium]
VLPVHEPVAPGLSLIALWAASGPMVGTWHSSTARSRILSAGYYVAQTAMEKLSGRIAVSEDARRTLVAHVGGDAVLIPNGVRVADYAPTSRHPGIDPGRPSILFLGRIDEPRKGLEVLTSALPAIIDEIPDLQVVVAGPGDEDDQRSRLDPRVADHGRCMGRLSDADKVRALRSVDLYIAPHTGGESFGIVLIEAMAAQTPVLASDLPAFRRVLQDGAAGAIFPTQDSAALASQAVTLLHDAKARERLVQAGQHRVRAFDWASVVVDVLAVYEAVTVTGEKVTEDLRGQIVGRFGSRGG